VVNTSRQNARRTADRWGRDVARQLADQAFSRASGAPLRDGNQIRILKNAQENYPAWLEAIGAARRAIDFEMYIIHEDDQGRRFAAELVRKASEGVRIRLLYDWMGGFGKTSRAFWNTLRAGGVEVRCYNPPRFDEPLGWVSRDHRKAIVVDSSIAFVTGLCVGQAWIGDPAKGIDPWRDTGIELRGPAVADVENAFAETWNTTGPLSSDAPVPAEEIAPAGDAAVRVVATVPNTAGLLRVDQLVAAVARETLWLTDAYFAGTALYIQALRAAAEDGVDVRLLVPGATDIPTIRLFSRAGYRPLLEAGVRVFEWNGPMLHAKTAVADRRWARVGSTNLNVASWMGNRELDVIVEDETFAREMQDLFEEDLQQATEVVLDRRSRVRMSGPVPVARRASRMKGSGGRVMAGAVRVGNAVTAAITNRRVLGPVEGHIAFIGGVLLLGVGILAAVFPRGLAYPVAAIAIWLALALILRGWTLYRERRNAGDEPPAPPAQQ
jgi:cardiolipin synthase